MYDTQFYSPSLSVGRTESCHCLKQRVFEQTAGKNTTYVSLRKCWYTGGKEVENPSGAETSPSTENVFPSKVQDTFFSIATASKYVFPI